MVNQHKVSRAEYITRARKVLQFEQQTQHRDQAIRPGGLESFVARWASEMTTLCQTEGLDVRPIYRFTEYLEGYRQQDPLQRASNIRAALALLEELEKPTPLSGRDQSILTTDDKSGRHQSVITPDEAKGYALSANGHDQSIPTGEPPRSRRDAVDRVQPVPAPNTPKAGIHLDAGMSQGHTTMALLNADITAVPGIGASVAAKLHNLGIRTVRDLLFYFPREHRDYSKLTKISHIPFNEVTTTMGLIWDVEQKRTSNGRTRTIATISDDTGKLSVTWFNQSYLYKQLKEAKDSYIVVTGVKQRFGNKVEFSVRSHEFPDQGDLLHTGRLVPIYPLTEGLHAKALRRYTKWVVDRYAAMIPDHLPHTIRSAGHLLTLSEAIAQIHYPENDELLQAARRRLAFDELFLIQLGMQERRTRWQYEAPQGTAFNIDYRRIFVHPPEDLVPPIQTTHDTPVEGDIPVGQDVQIEQISPVKRSSPVEQISPVERNLSTGRDESRPYGTLWSMVASEQPFEATLPFAFTPAQRRVICEICNDLAQSKPMCRLLQGDVGAGKTAVAAAALFMAASNGFQSALMAPTELLAEQHYRSVSKMLEPFGISTVLLSGSLRQRERQQARAALESGQASVAIGTHALIQEDVAFQKLGLVIVDEQHRFGVEQREALRQKGYHPHMLVMTATPIPRTLALTLYGDLDVSIIDQLPPGRQKIITRWRTGTRRNEAMATIVHEVAAGRQAFIICPLIEESDSLAAKAATTEYERLQREVFPNLRLGLLHGAMKAAEKDQVMRQFRDGELDILVATSVIEVGIDIPNATVMVIEDADRFGLSQLHQFRGRVGRGKHQSYCYVLSADASRQAQERLEVFQMTDDGFRLAEQDLKLRGPGDFFGVRQSGVPELRMADLSDMPLIELSRSLAAKLWQSDPYLRQPEHMTLRERVRLFWQDFMAQ